MTASMIDSTRFREVLGHYPTGVAVVTGRHPSGELVAMIVGSFTSVSLAPPLVAFFPAVSSATFVLLRDCPEVTVNVLSADQELLCQQIASKDEAWTVGDVWRDRQADAPRLAGAVAWLRCTYESISDAGDHFLAMLRVHDLGIDTPATPLLFFQGGYGGFAASSFMMPVEPRLVEAVRAAENIRQVMESVAVETGLRCHAVAAVGSELVLVATSGDPGVGSQVVGRRMPFMPPAGALFVQGDDAVREWRSRGKRVGAMVEDFDERCVELLATVAERGYSVALDDASMRIEEVMDAFSRDRPTPAVARELGRAVARSFDYYEPTSLRPDGSYRVRFLAAPVRDERGTTRLALTLAGFDRNLEGREVEALGFRLVEAANYGEVPE